MSPTPSELCKIAIKRLIHLASCTRPVGRWSQSWRTEAVTVITQQKEIGVDGGGVQIKNLLVEEVGRWLHRDAFEVKSERTKEIVRQIKPKNCVENNVVSVEYLTDGESSESD